MNEPVENLEMAETKGLVSDAYRGDSQSDTGERIAEVHRGDADSLRMGAVTQIKDLDRSSRFGQFINTC